MVIILRLLCEVHRKIILDAHFMKDFELDAQDLVVCLHSPFVMDSTQADFSVYHQLLLTNGVWLPCSEPGTGL